MRICALLSWYDEDPAWLDRMIRSLELVGVDKLIALDGAYALYPDGTARSHWEQHGAIVEAAAGIGAELTIHAPSRPWLGNEVGKRNHLFQMAENRTHEADWYMVVDADEEVVEAPDNVHERLEQAFFDVGAVTLNEPGHALGTVQFATFPMFFRAIRGIRCVGDHSTYQTPDGRKLWGDAKRDRLEPRYDLTDVVVTNHSQARPYARRDAQMAYYRKRDEHGIEELPDQRWVTA